MTQHTLFGRAGVGKTRDPLARFFTPLALARVICQALRDRLDLHPRTVLEPSVGGGNFVRAARETWPGCHVFGVDIDPKAEGFELCDQHDVGDFLEFGKTTARRFDLSIGNPPFTGAMAVEHIETSLRVADVVAAILPWSPLGGVGCWSHLMSGTGAPLEAWPVPKRPWPKSVRETAAHVWEVAERRKDKPDLYNRREWTRVWKLPRWK